MKHDVLRRLSFALQPRGGKPRLLHLAAVLISTCCVFAVPLSAAPVLHPPTDVSKVGQANTPVTAPLPDSLFKGVDTIVVNAGVSPNTPQLLNINVADTVTAMTESVQNIFSDASKTPPVVAVTIKKLYENQMEIDDLNKPDVVLVTFKLSVRQEDNAGKPIKIGSLSWEIRHFNSTLSFASDGVSYPFVIPDTKDELIQRIRDGVIYLASKLPRQFVCGNKYGTPTSDCPDCTLKACNFDRNYRGKQ
jgi:hypothetical protein